MKLSQSLIGISLSSLLFLTTWLPADEGDGTNVNAATLIQRGDAAYAQFDNEAALEWYQQAVAKDSTNYEALWKLGRAHVDVGKAMKDPLQRQHYFVGERILRKCVELYPDSAQGHFFLAAAIGRVALKVGGKEKINLSKEIKHEAERTLELNPRHDGAMHILGRWHYELGNLSWILKSFAKILYGGLPPGGGNEAAKQWFEQAIAESPEIPMHHLWLGMTLVKLEEYEQARQHLRRCIELNKVYWDDEEHKELAQKTLESIKDKP